MNGSILITGGLGKLGLCIGQDLINQYGVDLVLSGRSELTFENKEKINSLDRKNSKIHYLQADICNLQEMRNGLIAAEKEVAPIIGVIHMAGLFEPKTIINKSEKGFINTLMPKTKGVLVLDEITKEKELSYFIIFSSTSSVFGDFGQCDYAMGNSFLDSFATLRNKQVSEGKRKGRTILFNWPLWKEGGIHFGSNNEKFYLSSTGTDYLETSQGLKLFHQMLEGTENRLIVVPQKFSPENKTCQVDNKVENEQIDGDFVHERIKQTISTVLETDKEDIGSNQSFAELGFDSMSLKNFSYQLGVDFSINVNPSVFFAHSSVDSLANYLKENYEEKIKSLSETSEKSPVIEIEREEEQVISTIDTLCKGTDKVVHEKCSDCEDIAIIGMSGRFPGAENLEEFWSVLDKGKAEIKEIPSERWDWHEYYSKDRYEPNKTVSKWGGFLDSYREFDPGFFNISPFEAELMDPQHRLFLEEAWHAIEDAGYSKSQLSGRNIGVFGGIQFNEYEGFLKENGIYQPQVGSGNAHAMLCNRVSYIMDFHGPSESIDTACSSSLVAVHRAVEAIKHGECEMALAGGINLNLSPLYYIVTSQMGILSPDGKCKTFDKSANGYVRGEGVGLILLKPLKEAEKDHDHIYGILRSSAINHGGKANSPTAPNPQAQKKLIVDAYHKAGIKSEDISYIEVHGTGTELGDPVEIEALKEAFSELSENKEVDHYTCGLGSVKTNIGHLEPASGIAGIIKILQAMKHNKLPKTLNFVERNPYINLDNTPFYIVDSEKEWMPNGKKRIAGVSSFGFGGTNAHAVIEDYSMTLQNEDISECNVFVMSAKTTEQLKEYARQLYKRLSGNEVKKEERIQSLIKTTIAKILEVSQELIQEDEDISEYGLDRELYTTIAVNLSDVLNKNIIAEEIYGCRTIIEMSNNILAKYNLEVEDTTNYSDDRLCDILYTLQIGREEMEERLAFTVANKSDLLYKLSCYINDIPCENCYTARVDNKAEYKKYSFSECDGQVDSELIAKLFVQGYKIKWRSFYKNKPYRISLPGYPFSKKEYWYEEIEKSDDPIVKENVEECEIFNNKFNNEEIQKIGDDKFLVTLLSDKQFLKDHVINHKNIFPGVAYIELIREIESRYYQETIRVIRNICWFKPIYVTGKCEVFISFSKEADHVRFEISEYGKKDVCCSGIVELNKPDCVSKVVDINDIRHNCCKIIERTQCYELFNKRGYEYGTSFQKIDKIHYDKEALGQLTFIENNQEEMNLYPGVMDSILQTASVLIEDNKIYLPFSISKLYVFGPLNGTLYSYVKKKEDNSKGSISFNIDIYNEDGIIVIQIINFTMRLSLENKQNNLMFVEKNLVKKSFDKVCKAKSVLLFESDKSLYNELIKHNIHVVLVRADSIYRKVGPSEFSIQMQNQEDYEKVLEELEQPIDLIIHSYCKKTLADGIDAGLNDGLFSLAHLCNAHMKSDYRKVPCICVHYTREDGVNPQYSALAGFLRTLRKESYQAKYELLEIKDDVDMSRIATDIISENGEDIEVVYTKEGRFVKHFSEILSEENIMTNLSYNGVYVITGGLGGIGKLYAKHLLEKGATVILCGRKKVSTEILFELTECTQNDKLFYYSVDIADPVSVNCFLSEVMDRFTQINGIFHVAGIVEDKLFMNNTIDKMYTVIKPKVNGLINLISAIQKNKYQLDFILSFSSVSGMVGNRGQSDYAYANSFLEACTQLDLPFRIAAICWPYWKDGGMQIDDASLQWMEKQGLEALNTEDAIRIIDYVVMDTRIKSIGVLCGKADKCKAYLGEWYEPDRKESLVQIIRNEDNLNKNNQKVIQDRLINICSELLKVSKENFELEEELSSYGLDSILMMQLLNKIEKEFNVIVEPNLLTEKNTIAKITDYLIVEESVNLSNDNKDLETQVLNEKIIRDNNINQEQNKSKKIAVIGMACRFPGSNNLEEFWENLKLGKEMTSEVPKDRWSGDSYYDSNKGSFNKGYTKWGGFIDNIYQFDPDKFGIDESDASMIDPSQRIVLSLSDDLLKNAGYSKEEVNSSRTGVFIGGGESTYIHKNTSIIPEKQMKHLMVNSIQNMMAARISDYWNLKGPSMVIDTACSSSLVSIHQACQSIRNQECDMAIAGGVEVMTNPYYHIAFSKAEVLSDDKHCYVFDEKAKGFVLGEGAGLVLLKEYSKAVEDKDQIFGVICGSAVNNDGHTLGITVPSLEGQMEVIEEAISQSNVDRKTIGYLEAHGTGTLLGDPIEIKAATQVYGKGNQRKQYCGVGSVKSNIGHLMRAAGVASFIKVILALQHKQIPPTLNCSTPHKRFKFDMTPFYPTTRLQDWESIDGTYRGAISSFGFGGTNCHMIVEASEQTNGNTRKTIKQSLKKEKSYYNEECCKYGYSSENYEDDLMKTLDRIADGDINLDEALNLIELEKSE